MLKGNAFEGFRDPKRWRQMEDILDKIQDLDSPEMEQELKSHCGDDQTLFEEIKAILRVQREAPDFLEHSAAEELGFFFDTEERLVRDIEGIPDVRLLEKIGEGGMGRVYLIEQSAPAKRLAALKVIPNTWANEDLIRRFRMELRAMARMNHENVARLLEAGVTPDLKVPFFLMEYFPGKAITLYAQEESLTPQARLDLFLQVCKGVSHAHQQGIIHRDLKPGNILVATNDHVPLAKIIDFGISKALREDPDEQPATGLGMAMGTPAYMSPEQIDPSPVSVDTRSDIYSLGAVLYELMSNTTMIDRDHLKERSLSGKIEYLRNFRPVKLSKIKLPGHECLPRDLDWVLERATAFEKEQRYATVEEFAADVRHILNNQPVLARPRRSASYVLQKFIRRHLFAVSATVMFLSLLLVSGSALLFSHQRKVASEQRATSALEILKEMFRAANSRQQGRNLTVREVLTNLEPFLRGEDPLVRAQIQVFSAETLSSLGQGELALCDALDASEVLFRELGDDDPKTIESLLVLAMVHQRMGSFDQAERLYANVLQRELGVSQQNRLSAMNGLAEIFRTENELDLATFLFSATFDGYWSGEASSNLYNTARGLGICLFQEGDIAASENILSWAESQQTKQFGPHHKDTLATHLYTLTIWERQGLLLKAESGFAALFRESCNRFGDRDPLSLEAELQWARIRFRLGCDEGLLEELADLNVRITQELGPNQPLALESAVLYALTLKNSGLLPFAATMLETCISHQAEQALGDVKSTFYTVCCLADIYQGLGCPKDSINSLQSLPFMRRSFTRQHKKPNCPSHGKLNAQLDSDPFIADGQNSVPTFFARVPHPAHRGEHL